jgi:hypothetical protein
MNGTAPGNSTRQLARQRHTHLQTLAILGLIALAAILLAYHSVSMAIGFPLALAGFWAVNHYVVGRINIVQRREQQAVRGAEAEEMVGAILNRLPPGHQVFHDVPAPHGNIDHLVFRRDGAVFVIETKSHRGDVTLDHCELRRDHRPFEKDFIRQTLENVSWLKKFIATHLGFEPRWIHAAIVFTRAHVPSRCQLSRVNILRPVYLERWLNKQPGDAEAALKLWPRRASLEEFLGKSLS